jgi:hypothetical protein
MIISRGEAVFKNSDHLPGTKIIGAEIEVPDMKWIWEVFGHVISFGP